MSTTLEGLPGRVDRLEEREEKTRDHLARIDTVIGEIRNDLRWMKWILLVFIPFIVAQTAMMILAIIKLYA